MSARPADIRLSGFKFLHHMERIEQIAERRPVAEIPPVTVEIDPTNICNSNCWWCSTANTRREDPGGLSRQEVLDVISQAAELGAKSVVFKGGGEPTLQPYLAEAIEHGGSAGLGVGMNTNGVNFTGELVDALVTHASWVRFSIDAASPDIYHKVHRRDDFEAVKDNVHTLVQRRNAERSPLLVGINNCLDQYNLTDPEALLAFAAETGVDYVACRPAYFEIAPTAEGRRQLRELRAEIIRVLQCIGQLAERFPDLSVRLGNVRNGRYELDDPGSCLAPALTAVVTATGEVVGCCDLRGQHQYAFGNIRTASLREIWSSERRAKSFEKTSRRDCDKFCSHAYAGYNQIIDYLSQQSQDGEFL